MWLLCRIISFGLRLKLLYAFVILGSSGCGLVVSLVEVGKGRCGIAFGLRLVVLLLLKGERKGEKGEREEGKGMVVGRRDRSCRTLRRRRGNPLWMRHLNWSVRFRFGCLTRLSLETRLVTRLGLLRRTRKVACRRRRGMSIGRVVVC